MEKLKNIGKFNYTGLCTAPFFYNGYESVTPVLESILIPGRKEAAKF